ncbi:hypothetical protein N798_00195 [Knoellia flava TL1]|uniref:NYN domain-containing protein n=2 Tax=Knoellia flava TaxID=913969 RepID=A0A8H9FU27_9MICO|nr:NYN domain-containing protein [Knoellia flava]KGN35728.1 hypothetical protein N798_00195 [Knoellia flava TL1]GGB81454.1 hypothetical protein GCM10011314_21330 [Knoellia flava]
MTTHPTTPTPAPTARSDAALPAARGRTLHLVDIENLVLGRPTPANVQRAWAAYQRIVGVSAGDQVRIACADAAAAAVAFSISTGRQLLLAGHGPNAADLALIESVDIDYTARRWGHVVIASADHIFAPLAGALTRAGCTVSAAHLTPCAAALRLATHTQHQLRYCLTLH